jgi:hypothetical protein
MYRAQDELIIREIHKMKRSQKRAFLVAPGVVGGIVIGIAAGTDLSPVLAGLLGAILISVSVVILSVVGGELKFGE